MQGHLIAISVSITLAIAFALPPGLVFQPCAPTAAFIVRLLLMMVLGGRVLVVLLSRYHRQHLRIQTLSNKWLCRVVVVLIIARIFIIIILLLLALLSKYLRGRVVNVLFTFVA